jgi:hypothetical protein
MKRVVTSSMFHVSSSSDADNTFYTYILNSLRTVLKYGLDDRNSISGRDKDISLHHNFQTAYVAHLTSYRMHSILFPPGIKRSERESDHSSFFFFRGYECGLKITVFCDVTLCTLVDSYECFGEPCCLHLQGRRRNSGDGGSNFSRNVYTHLPNYTVWNYRKLLS